MMPKVVAIYGKSCTLKSDIAREISRLTGYKVKHVGEGVTTRAKVLGLDSGVDVEDAYHRSANKEAIDDIVKQMMRKYNSKKAFIFNTIQMYRKDRIAYLKELFADAKNLNYFLGLKPSQKH